MKKKNSIKRAQSQAGLSFAERKNFRPMAKILTLLVLLMTAVTGAWADTTVTFTASDLADGSSITKDGVTLTAYGQYGINMNGVNGPGEFTNSLGGNFTKIVVTADGLPSGDGWSAGTWTGSASSVSFTGNIETYGGEFTIVCTLETPAAETPAVTPTGNKNEWTFTMPDYDVELEVEYDTELALNEVDDNAAKLDEWNGYEADVTLTRTLAAGVWNTLAAPFGISATNYATLQQLLSAQGGTIAVKELTSTTLSGQTLTLNFTDATQIEAGKPYLVKVSKELDLATLPAQIDALSSPINPFKGVIISKTAVPVETSYVNFIPTLGKTLVTGPAGNESSTDAVLFLAANNTLKNPTVVNDPEQQSSYLKGFRAYFQLKDASNARSITLNIDGESTGITTTDFTDSTDKAGAVYDLQGRKVNAAQKGVYIQNGRKVVIK